MIFRLFCMLAALLSFADRVFAETITVTTVADEVAVDGACSLREAINAFNAADDNGPECVATGPLGGAWIIELGALTYPISIDDRLEDANAKGDFDITQSGVALTIRGPSGSVATIDATTRDRAFQIVNAGSTVTFERLNFIHGVAVEENGGAIYVSASNVTLTVRSSVFQGNEKQQPPRAGLAGPSTQRAVQPRSIG